MNTPRYTVAIDLGSGAISYNGVVLTADSTQPALEKAMEPLIARRSMRHDGSTQWMFGPGTFLGLPCGAGPIWQGDELVWNGIVVEAEFALVAEALANNLGIVLRGQAQEKYPWGALFFEVTGQGNFAIIHVFDQNARRSRERQKLTPAQRRELAVREAEFSKYVALVDKQCATPATAIVVTMLNRLHRAGFDEISAKRMAAAALREHLDRCRAEKRPFDFNAYVGTLASMVAPTTS